MSRGRMHDAIVVGGGLVGAATALALERAGLQVVLVEARAPEPWHADAELDLRVVALAPSSARLFAQLGVWNAVVAARVSAYTRMHVWDASSGASVHFDAASRGYAELGWIVENRLLQHVLWQALDHAGVERRCPARVAGFHTGEDRRCPARVAGFHTGEDRAVLDLEDGSHVAARMVIAADGGASPLREMAGIDTEDRDYAQRAVVAHVRCEHAHESTAWQRFLPGGPVAFLPLADGRCSIVWSLPEAQAKHVIQLDDTAFCHALGVASDFRLGQVLASSARAAFPLRLKLARRYHARRFVLIGDAAHVVHPLAGQGVNLGLRDVVELRDVLLAARKTNRDIAADDVLARYARRRRAANTSDAWSFDAIARAFAWQAPPLVAARGLGMRLLERAQPVKQRLAEHAAGD